MFTRISARWLVCLPCSRSATFLQESSDKLTDRLLDLLISFLLIMEILNVGVFACLVPVYNERVFSQWVVVAPVDSDSSSGSALSVGRAAAVSVNNHSVSWTEGEQH